MKIEIEWSSSYEADMFIDGKAMKIQMRSHPIGTHTCVEGLSEDEYEKTLGGRVANAIYGVIADCMQAEAKSSEIYDPLEDSQDAPSWVVLPDDAIEAFDDRVNS